MRVILLTHGGAELVVEELAKLDGVELVGVFIETVTTPKRTRIEKLRRSVKYDGLVATAAKFVKPPGSVNGHPRTTDPLREAAARRHIPVADVENFHSEGSINMLRSAEADLGIIYGTNIIKESVFSIPRLGSINLHQGLAPFYRGGPPVFWELFNDEREVGLTVHFVAPKVDTGDIILQKSFPLVYDRSHGSNFDGFIEGFRSELRKPSAQLIANAVELIASGNFDRTSQDTTLGHRYRLPTKKEKDEMRRRLKARLGKEAV